MPLISEQTLQPIYIDFLNGLDIDELSLSNDEILSAIEASLAHLYQDRSGSVEVLALSALISPYGLSAANASITAGRSSTRS